MAGDLYPSAQPRSAAGTLAALDATTTSTALVSGTATTAAAVPVALAAVWWSLTMTHASGRAQRVVRAALDAAGTAADWDESGPDDADLWTGAITCDVSGGQLRLRITAPSTGWTASVSRLYHDAA